MKVLLDTNVILDFALRREPFFQNAQALFDNADDRLELYFSPSACTDVYYILRRASSRQTALDFLTDLLNICETCTLDKRVLLDALQSSFKDFEDAVQHYAAVATRLDAIVTRNGADFVDAAIPVLTPAELIATINNLP